MNLTSIKKNVTISGYNGRHIVIVQGLLFRMIYYIGVCWVGRLNLKHSPQSPHYIENWYTPLFI